jgi:type IX secretion system PorP/SprF family membrane protein
MKYTAKIRMSLLSLLLAVGCLHAQDTRFSQPMNSPLQLNPAMMGLSDDVRVSLNYRNQWASIDNGFTTYSLEGMAPLFLSNRGDSSKRDLGKSRLDFGVNIVDDRSGGFNRINATFNIGYGLKLNASNQIYAALNVGYIQYAFGTMNQSFDEQYQYGAYNPQLANNESITGNKGKPDVGLGFMWHFTPESNRVQAFAGLSGFHVNQPNLSLLSGGSGTLPARFDFQAGVKIIGNKMDFTPVVLYDLQGPFKQFTGGILADYKVGDKGSKGKLEIGAWYRQNQAITVQGGYNYKFLMFAYSYDFGISDLTHVTHNLMTHELTLAFKLYDKAGKKGVKSTPFL